MVKIFNLGPRKVFLTILTVQMVFAIFPNIDLAISALFYIPDDGFFINDIPAFQILRETIWLMIVFVFLGAVIIVITQCFLTIPQILDGKVFELIVLTYLLGPGLLVNGILKSFWGRARPAKISEFGGDKQFTPPFELTDQCAQNCSFTSGEGAGAAAMLISIYIISKLYATKRIHRLVVCIAVIIASTGMVMRVAMGRHFISDTLFSFFFVLLCTTLLMLIPRYNRFQKVWSSK